MKIKLRICFTLIFIVFLTFSQLSLASDNIVEYNEPEHQLAIVKDRIKNLEYEFELLKAKYDKLINISDKAITVQRETSTLAITTVSIIAAIVLAINLFGFKAWFGFKMNRLSEKFDIKIGNKIEETRTELANGGLQYFYTLQSQIYYSIARMNFNAVNPILPLCWIIRSLAIAAKCKERVYDFNNMKIHIEHLIEQVAARNLPVPHERKVEIEARLNEIIQPEWKDVVKRIKEILYILPESNLESSDPRYST